MNLARGPPSLYNISMETLSIAEKEIGVTSDVSGSVNPRVLEYFAKIGATYEPGDDEIWCAAFVGFVLETAGIRSTRVLNARSYLGWGNPTTKPVQGDVAVFWRDSIASANGHVSFYHHEDENTVYCLGGNQGSGMVDIEGYPKTRVLDYRSAITTSVPQAQKETIMEPVTTAETPVEITPTTPQTLKIATVTVHFTEEEGSQSTAGDIVIPVTPEIVAATQAQCAPEFNITVIA